VSQPDFPSFSKLPSTYTDWRKPRAVDCVRARESCARSRADWSNRSRALVLVKASVVGLDATCSRVRSTAPESVR